MNDEQLFESGRAMGSRLLKAAVEGAEKDSQKLSEGIFVCRATALHILAQELWNRVRMGQNLQSELDSIREELIWELRELEGGESEVSFLKGETARQPRLTVVKGGIDGKR